MLCLHPTKPLSQVTVLGSPLVAIVILFSIWVVQLPLQSGGVSSKPGTVSLKNVFCWKKFIHVSYKWSHSYLASHFVFQIKHRAPDSFTLKCKHASLLSVHDFSVEYVWKQWYLSAASFSLKSQDPLNIFIRCSRVHYSWHWHSICFLPLFPCDTERNFTSPFSSLFSSW